MWEIRAVCLSMWALLACVTEYFRHERMQFCMHILPNIHTQKYCNSVFNSVLKKCTLCRFAVHASFAFVPIATKIHSECTVMITLPLPLDLTPKVYGFNSLLNLSHGTQNRSAVQLTLTPLGLVPVGPPVEDLLQISFVCLMQKQDHIYKLK